MAVADCAADQPVLTLVFERLPMGTKLIEVTLHGHEATFMGPDAGNDQVGVSYDGGNVRHPDLGRRMPPRGGNHIRLPLTAGDKIQLDGTAHATGGGETKIVETSVSVMARRSATMTFDFGSTDGGTEAPAGDGHADADVDANEAGAGDIPADVGSDVASSDVPADVPTDLARDVPAEMPGTDVAPDKAQADVAVEMPSPTDTSGDVPPIGTSCALHGPYAASIGPGGSGRRLRMRLRCSASRGRRRPISSTTRCRRPALSSSASTRRSSPGRRRA